MSSSPPSTGERRPSSEGLKSSPSSGDRKQRDYVAEAARLISEMQIDVPERPKVPQNMPPGTLGAPCQVQTNAYGMVIDDDTDVYIFDIRIYAKLKDGTKIVEFSKKSNQDCLVNERKEKCISILKKMMEIYPQTFPDAFKTYYDGQSMLFTLYPIFANNQEYLEMKEFTISPSILQGLLGDVENVVVELKQTEKGSFTLGSRSVILSTANLEIEANDRYLTQFLEIAVNQYAIMNPERHKVFEHGKTFMTQPLREGLQRYDLKDVGDGKVLMVGAQKSIRQIEGPRGRGTNNSAIIIDAKKAAFHAEMDLATKVQHIIGGKLNGSLSDHQRDKVLGVIKGLYVETMHLKSNKHLQVFGLSKHSADESVFEQPEGKISVNEYFSKKYKFNLKFPNLPMILARERGQMNCYPLEVVKVVPFQRVTIPQLTSAQSQLTTKECAVNPETRQFYIHTNAVALDVINPHNMYLKNIKVRVYPVPIRINARQLPYPSIRYGHGKEERVDFGKWKMGRGHHYLIPSVCERWALYCFQEVQKYTTRDLNAFVRDFLVACRNKGMRIADPLHVGFATETEIEQKLAVAANEHCTFALCLVQDSIGHLHKEMKYYERKYEITTQQINTSNIDKIMTQNKFVTLENIINKFNCKLGGLNYSIDIKNLNGVTQKWFTTERMYIGISLSHPPPKANFSGESPSLPTVVGYAANMKFCPYEIVGDFFLQDSKKGDTLSCIAEIVKQCATRHRTAHTGAGIKELVIYRSNLDEGSHGKLIMKEIPLVRATLKKIGLESTKLAFITVSKEHNVRFFKENIENVEKISEQNIPAGIVCDTNIAHPSFKEFYLNSHTTIQGSAKTPRYSVLYDDMEMTSDDMEGMSWVLAHGHQIVSLTTSLPAPLYIAQRYAERGRMVHSQFMHSEDSSSENTSGYDDIQRLLAYNTSKMANCRLNA